MAAAGSRETFATAACTMGSAVRSCSCRRLTSADRSRTLGRLSEAPSASGDLSRIANWFLRTSMRATFALQPCCDLLVLLDRSDRSDRRDARKRLDHRGFDVRLQARGRSSWKMTLPAREDEAGTRNTDSGRRSWSRVSEPWDARRRRTATRTTRRLTCFVSRSDETIAPSASPAPPQTVRDPEAEAGGPGRSRSCIGPPRYRSDYATCKTAGLA